MGFGAPSVRLFRCTVVQEVIATRHMRLVYRKEYRQERSVVPKERRVEFSFYRFAVTLRLTGHRRCAIREEVAGRRKYGAFLSRYSRGIGVGFRRSVSVLANLVSIVGFVAVIGLFIELNDRQSQRVTESWEVIHSTATAHHQASVSTNPDAIESYRLLFEDTRVRSALVYLNSVVADRWCSDQLLGQVIIRLVRWAAGEDRSCVLSGKAKSSFRGAYLRDTYLGKAGLNGSDFRGARLEGANMRGAYLSGAKFDGAKLVRTNLVDADLVGATFLSADLRGAAMCDADLSGADLTNANLSGANLTGAKVSGTTKWTGADVSGAVLPASFEENKLDIVRVYGDDKPTIAGAMLRDVDCTTR